MSKTKKEKVQKMIDLYNQGYNLTEISKEIDITPDTISKHLKKLGVYKRKKSDRLTDEDVQIITDLYQNGEMQEILDKYTFLKKSDVYRLMSNRGISNKSYFWSEEDIEYLRKNFGKISYDEMSEHMNDRHSAKAISAKATQLGLSKKKSEIEWSDEEIDIMLKYYSNAPLEDFMKMLPNRTYNAIVCRGMILGVQSYQYLSEKYTPEEEQFIIDNSYYMTDEEIAKYLGRGLHGVQDKRRSLGLYFFDKKYSNYENFACLFRGHIQDWKTRSMKKCNYQCILTGSSDFHIHHLYAMNMIVKETLEILDDKGLLKGDDLSNYSKNELDNILSIFSEIHSQYPTGICIHPDIHKLFHQIYGAGGNTPEQWNRFYWDYKSGKYNNNLVA